MFFQCLALRFNTCFGIHFCCRNIFMAKKILYVEDIDSSFQEMHRFWRKNYVVREHFFCLLADISKVGVHSSRAV